MSAISTARPIAATPPARLLWRASQMGAPLRQVLASGWAELDAVLPAGGWPRGELTEVLLPDAGGSEWRLLGPALRRLRPLALLVNPPMVPFAPALRAQGIDTARLLWVRAETPATQQWACEQALHCADVQAVLAWLPQARATHLRRLQVAAQSMQPWLVVFRPLSAQAQSSPAPLRLTVRADEHALSVSLIKRRGPPLEDALHLPARAPRLRAALAASRELRESCHAVVPPAQALSHAVDRAATRAACACPHG